MSQHPSATLFDQMVRREPEGCWTWWGAQNNHGYGRCGRVYAHRVSWEIHRGPIPAGQLVLHRCDNPPCTNPDHLFLGTQKDNMADAKRKGRLGGSPKRGQKITIRQARKIRELYQQGVPREELSRRYRLHVDTIRGIGTGRLWKDA